ncbi:hypothetical protein HYH03_004890 [Edaphochlamys debaryana]|uniref:Uncharacterized protein n=1 Tax=Edaphochlamys debaryana TaxID=47281 RepID=A0A836C2Y7_9CHLO|nr:hypothetical protein HYH03_004890 [Edaphochlamys debaryana]|eukprot:KAG2497307.1 hypothetical protein HYH03_004890 [Edaphochlamys debaryana]
MSIDVGDWLSEPGSAPKEPCGLFVKDKKVSVPLRRRDVTATIHADACFADTTETLSYVADEDCTAVFRFPLPPRAAVYRFRAVMGDNEVVTRVKPRSEAREEYQLAVSQGHSAVHMSQHEKGASVFEVSLGNLEAHSEVSVEFGYLRLLDSFGGTLEWVHTATWVPPYVGSAGDAAEGVDKVVASLPTFAAKVSYSLSYKVSVLGSVRSVESPEPVTVTKPAPEGGAQGPGAWQVALAESVADPSKDLTLLIEMEPAAARRSSLRAQRTPASRPGDPRTVVLASFVPPLPEPGSARPALRKEIWFVVDCSGSMGGSPIAQAREAALFFVRDLPVDSGVRFNVTCFGSSHKSLYDSCRPYDSATEKQAVPWIQQHVQADMGGTEILATLKHVYDSPVTPGYTREIIFLTDGGISGHEEQAVYDLISSGSSGRPRGKVVSAIQNVFKAIGDRVGSKPKPPAANGDGTPEGPAEATAEAPGADVASRTHVLCLGIGHGVHRGLLDGMASRSAGAVAYVVDDEAIAAKTAFLKKAAIAQGAAMRPRLLARGALVKTAPHVLPQRVFAGEPLHVLCEVLSCEPDATLELTADFCDGAAPASAPAKLQLSLPLGPVVGGGAAVEEGQALPVLHAMAYIGSLMAGTSPLHVLPDGSPQASPPSADLVKEAVVRLAVAEHLVTPHTSAVGVALRRDPADPAAAANVVEVPLQLPHGRSLWGTHDGMPQAQAQAQPMMACMAFGAAPPCPPGGGGAPPRMMLFGAAPAPAAAPMMSFGAVGSARCRASSGRGGGFGGGGGPPMRRTCGTPVPSDAQDLACASAVPACATPPPPPAYAQDDEDEAEGGAGGLFDEAVCTERMREAAPPSSMLKKKEKKSAAKGKKAQFDSADWSLSRSAPEKADVEAADMDVEMAEVVKEQAEEKGSPGRLSGSALLAHLNLSRTTEGFWRASPGLAAALGLPAELLTSAAAAAGGGGRPMAGAAALRPAGLSDDAWATVVVLACLRRSLPGQRSVWGDMEAKALAWLDGCWPEGGRSMGSTVLALAKEVPEAA